MYSFYDEEQHKVSLNFSSRTAWLPAQLRILDIYISPIHQTWNIKWRIGNIFWSKILEIFALRFAAGLHLRPRSSGSVNQIIEIHISPIHHHALHTILPYQCIIKTIKMLHFNSIELQSTHKATCHMMSLFQLIALPDDCDTDCKVRTGTVVPKPALRL